MDELIKQKKQVTKEHLNRIPLKIQVQEHKNEAVRYKEYTCVW